MKTKWCVLVVLSTFASQAAEAGDYACKVWCEGRGGVVRARLGSITIQAAEGWKAQEIAKEQIQPACNNYGFHGPSRTDGGTASAYADCWSK